MAKIFTRKNSPYWWSRYKGPDGQEVRCSLKVPNSSGFKKVAQLKASQLEIDHWQAWKEGKLDKPQYSFEELMIGWIEERKPGSADLTNVSILRKEFSGRILDEITGSDIANCKRIWRNKGLSNNTIRRRLSTFSSAITYARSEWEWDINNPITGRLPAEEKFEADHMNYKQAQAFVNALHKRQYQPYNAPHLLDFFILAVHTGMRKSEILGCSISQIDLENNCIHLKKHQQKGRIRTATPLNTESLEAIKRRLGFIKENFPETNWIFPNPKSNGENPIKDVKTAFNTLRLEVSCPKIRIHDLRHTFASWLVQRGKSLYEVSKALRHSSLKPTERYAHLELDHLRSTHNDITNVPVDFQLNNSPENKNSFHAKIQWQEALKQRGKSKANPSFAHSSHTKLALVK